jgi:hypothetical protein
VSAGTGPPGPDGPPDPDQPGRNGEDGPGEQVGSVADEAAKLFGALSDWARDHGSDLSGGLSGLASQAAASARDVNEHVNERFATGSAECAYCPICRTVHAVRSASPEVRGHLTVAAASLMQAAAGLLATAASDEQRARAASGDGFEHIDLEDDPDEPDDEPDEDDR